MDVRRQVRLHVFTDRKKEFGAKVKRMGLAGNVLFQRYLPYLEFLNISTRFDVLVVNDVGGAAAGLGAGAAQPGRPPALHGH